jgi:MFS superfamily sulfate permease-like transporter
MASLIFSAKEKITALNNKLLPLRVLLLCETANEMKYSKDIMSGMVVFLVALPLCLGIAVASGAPPFAGIIAGIIGGIVVGAVSGSPISVSGPAAGLTSIVMAGIDSLPSYEVFLVAVFLSGLFQIIFGLVKGGFFAGFFPSSVIHGMMAAIGAILILKQIPHALGYDKDPEGDESFLQLDGENTLSELIKMLDYVDPIATSICALGILILVIWNNKKISNHPILGFIPGPLLVVGLGILVNEIMKTNAPESAITGDHMVQLPVLKNPLDITKEFRYPDFANAINNSQAWLLAFTIAVVASIESLLSLEASDRLDPLNRISPPNRELIAQGTGNTLSGLIGGLPVTAVIVRSSANATAGARTKVSTIIHGLLLLISVLFLAKYMNLIPKSALAAVLLTIGYKLTSISTFKKIHSHGKSQFRPFLITFLAILFTNLLIGIFIGLLVGLYFVLKSNSRHVIHLANHGDNYLLTFNKDVSFLNKPIIREKLDEVPEGSKLIIDGTKARFIDHDVLEELELFKAKAKSKFIQVEFKNMRSL